MLETNAEFEEKSMGKISGEVKKETCCLIIKNLFIIQIKRLVMSACSLLFAVHLKITITPTGNFW